MRSLSNTLSRGASAGKTSGVRETPKSPEVLQRTLLEASHLTAASEDQPREAAGSKIGTRLICPCNEHIIDVPGDHTFFIHTCKKHTGSRKDETILTALEHLQRLWLDHPSQQHSIGG